MLLKRPVTVFHYNYNQCSFIYQSTSTVRLCHLLCVRSCCSLITHHAARPGADFHAVDCNTKITNLECDDQSWAKSKKNGKLGQFLQILVKDEGIFSVGRNQSMWPKHVLNSA